MCHAYENEILHSTAQQGILNLLLKGDKDSRFLKNLRPITLLNCDYKIIEKAISNRMMPSGALQRPKGILQHSKKPNGPTVNAVSGILASSNSTCQYPLFRSKVVNVQAPLRESKDSSIRGSAYASFTVLLFNFLRSIQNLNSPDFFQTRTTALAHGLHDLLIAPTSNIVSKDSYRVGK